MNFFIHLKWQTSGYMFGLILSTYRLCLAYKCSLDYRGIESTLRASNSQNGEPLETILSAATLHKAINYEHL